MVRSHPPSLTSSSGASFSLPSSLIYSFLPSFRPPNVGLLPKCRESVEEAVRRASERWSRGRVLRPVSRAFCPAEAAVAVPAAPVSVGRQVDWGSSEYDVRKMFGLLSSSLPFSLFPGILPLLLLGYPSLCRRHIYRPSSVGRLLCVKRTRAHSVVRRGPEKKSHTKAEKRPRTLSSPQFS